MKCSSCQSNHVQLIKILAGNTPLMWAPANGEKDIFGGYKNAKPVHAHACQICGHVFWNITLDRDVDPGETAQALDALTDIEGPDDDAVFLAQDE